LAGTTTAEGGDGAPEPFAFAAVTVHVYDFPFDKPPTTIGETAPAPVPGAPPLEDAHVTP